MVWIASKTRKQFTWGVVCEECNAIGERYGVGRAGRRFSFPQNDSADALDKPIPCEGKSLEYDDEANGLHQPDSTETLLQYTAPEV
jgi:hypothetical protein